MFTLLALLVLPPEAIDVPGLVEESAPCLDIVCIRGAHLAPATPRPTSKKDLWLADKARRPNVHVLDDAFVALPVAPPPRAGRPGVAPPAHRAAAALAPEPPPSRPGDRLIPLTTLYNVWTREALPILPGQQMSDRFHRFLRDHFTNQATRMDERLIDVLRRVAVRFQAPRIEVVSGFRSPKYNLMLRKKGHQVARSSQHLEGTAVDFRIQGVKTKALLMFVRGLRAGGVGYYPQSQFVHSDTGKIRYWTGS